jgi:DNA-binding IclR family transcriptional regulator
MLAEYEPAVGETVPPNLARLLERIRARGHERMRSQQIRGVVNLSVPIVGPDGSALAALSVPFLERIDRPDAPELDVVLARMLEFAGRISAAIGGVPVARLQLPSRPYV